VERFVEAVADIAPEHITAEIGRLGRRTGQGPPPRRSCSTGPDQALADSPTLLLSLHRYSNDGPSRHDHPGGMPHRTPIVAAGCRPPGRRFGERVPHFPMTSRCFAGSAVGLLPTPASPADRLRPPSSLQVGCPERSRRSCLCTRRFTASNTFV
jgi:hypothetical protein